METRDAFQKTLGAAQAAFYPSDEACAELGVTSTSSQDGKWTKAFRGVRDWLDARGLRRHFPAVLWQRLKRLFSGISKSQVNQWCKEMGAAIQLQSV